MSPSPPPTTPRLSSHFQFFNLPVHRRPVAGPPLLSLSGTASEHRIRIFPDDSSICVPVDRLDWQRAATTHSWRQTLAPSPRTDADCSTWPVASRRYLSQSIASIHLVSQPAARPSTELTCITQLFLFESALSTRRPPPPIQIQGPDCRFSCNRLQTSRPIPPPSPPLRSRHPPASLIFTIPESDQPDPIWTLHHPSIGPWKHVLRAREWSLSMIMPCDQSPCTQSQASLCSRQ